MKIIFGLGNPGKEYDKTRHNVGWMALDYLASLYSVDISKSNCNCLTGQTVINGEQIVFAKPLTYMNLSGNAVVALKNWFKVDNKDILIIFDDVDIPFGTIRYRQKGSGGTHNGMKNIVQMLSSEQIPRIRIGLGGLKYPKQDMVEFVLEKFKKDEIKKLEEDVFVQVESKFKEFLDN